MLRPVIQTRRIQFPDTQCVDLALTKGMRDMKRELRAYN
jgi:hypothetical protein